MNDLALFLESPAGLALKAVLVVAFLDFATGTFAAFRDGTFALDAVAAFARKHLAGRVFPIGLLLAVGYFGGAAGQLFLAGAIAAAGIYVAETASSVWGNIAPPKPSEQIAAEDGVLPIDSPVNPIPQD